MEDFLRTIANNVQRGNNQGGGCNTPGVYHSLSSGFKLKHYRLVEMTMSRSTYGDEPNLKLDAAPLLYI
jgi:hypothetical protein